MKKRKKLLLTILLFSLGPSSLALSELTHDIFNSGPKHTVVAASSDLKKLDSTQENKNLPHEKVNVTTDNGEIVGIQNERAQIFYGIPYAKSVAGDKRWTSPEKPDDWDNALDATKPSKSFLQYNNGEIFGSEDALTLDIYQPTNTETKDLPVFVYIHGGNNQTSSSNELSGESFVENYDAIVVTINYRLGVFGYNPLPAIKEQNNLTTGNLGLLDIQQSLQWVQNNIESFNGDTNNITLAGFSAGARDIIASLSSPLFQNLYHKVIPLSGGITLPDEELSAKKFADVFAPLVVEDNIKDTEKEAKEWLLSDDPELINYLRSIDGDRLAPLMAGASLRMSNFPHLYRDNSVIPAKGYKSDNFNDVPILVVSSNREFSLFSRSSEYFTQGKYAELEGSLEDQLEFTDKYGSKLYDWSNSEQPISILYEHNENPIYSLNLTFGDDDSFNNYTIDEYGSFHGVWMTLFDHDNTVYEENYGEVFKTQGAKDLQVLFQDIIYNFMVTDDPNGRNDLEWNAWSPNQPNQLTLGATTDTIEAEMTAKDFTYGSTIIDIEQDTTIPEETKAILLEEVLSGRWFSKRLDEHFGNEWPIY